MNVVIKYNFKENFADIWRNELESVGFDTSSIEDKDIPFKYFTVVLRTIEKKPRKIYKSATFTCPAELKTGLSMLEN